MKNVGSSDVTRLESRLMELVAAAERGEEVAMQLFEGLVDVGSACAQIAAGLGANDEARILMLRMVGEALEDFDIEQHEWIVEFARGLAALSTTDVPAEVYEDLLELWWSCAVVICGEFDGAPDVDGENIARHRLIGIDRLVTLLADRALPEDERAPLAIDRAFQRVLPVSQLIAHASVDVARTALDAMVASLRRLPKDRAMEAVFGLIAIAWIAQQREPENEQFGELACELIETAMATHAGASLPLLEETARLTTGSAAVLAERLVAAAGSRERIVPEAAFEGTLDWTAPDAEGDQLLVLPLTGDDCGVTVELRIHPDDGLLDCTWVERADIEFDGDPEQQLVAEGHRVVAVEPAEAALLVADALACSVELGAAIPLEYLFVRHRFGIEPLPLERRKRWLAAYEELRAENADPALAVAARDAWLELPLPSIYVAAMLDDDPDCYQRMAERGAFTDIEFREFVEEVVAAQPRPLIARLESSLEFEALAGRARHEVHRAAAEALRVLRGPVADWFQSPWLVSWLRAGLELTLEA